MIKLEHRISFRRAKIVLEHIMRQGISSKQELLEHSKFTGSTMSRILEDLEKQGMIEQAGFGESTGGRKPTLYRPNPRYGYLFGLDISRTYSHLILYDFVLNKLEEKRWRMDNQMTPDVLFELIIEFFKKMCHRHKLTSEQLIGMGVGAVGPLDVESGLILEPLYFPAVGWKHVRLREKLESELGIPIYLENGANTAVFGEYWKDPQQQFRHLLYLHAGAGLRSSMMTNGRIVYGGFDMEGAVGQMIIDADGVAPREAWGNRGALESYATTYAIEKQAREKLGRDIEWNDDLLTQDPELLELLQESARLFGIGIANVVNIMHPEKVILGGPLIAAHPLFFQVATETAIKHICYYPAYHVQFTRGRLGEEAIAAGAAALLLQRLVSEDLV
jgi:predicted NBD/HSP70 family sugar kinase